MMRRPLPTTALAVTVALSVGLATTACSTEPSDEVTRTTGAPYFPDGVPVVGDPLPTVQVDIWFLDADATPPRPRSVARQVPGGPEVDLATTALAAVTLLFAGPSSAEAEAGLVLERSGTTGFSTVEVTDHVATVALTGGCAPDPERRSTVADLIVRTLKGIDGIDAVVVLTPTRAPTTTTTATTATTTGATTTSTGPTTSTTIADSIPPCLARPTPSASRPVDEGVVGDVSEE